MYSGFKIIDAHSHFPVEDQDSKKMENFAKTMASPEKLEELRKLGEKGEDGPTKAQQQWRSAWGFSRPKALGLSDKELADKWAADKLEAAAQKNLKGYKVLAPLHDKPITSTELYPLWEVCADYGLPVLIHFGILGAGGGISHTENINPAILESVAKEFPGVNFIIPHFGCGYPRELLFLGWVCENIYVDTSGSNQWMRWMPYQFDLKIAFRKFYKTFGPERIIFGTDSSWFPRGFAIQYLQEQFKAVRFMGIPEREIELIFAKNIARLLTNHRRSSNYTNNIGLADSYVDTILRPIFGEYKENYAAKLYQINLAHAVMLKEEKIIPADEAREILRALEEIESELRGELAADELEYSGDFTDYYFLVEKRLIKRLGVEVAGKLHTGRSRNDINATSFKLVLRDKVLDFLALLLDLAETLAAKVEQEKEAIFLAYTHGQPAQPITFGHFLAAVLEFILRDLERFFNSLDDLNKSSLGAAAIATTGFAINRERTAELLGFIAPQENSYGAITAADHYLAVYSNLQIFLTQLSRLFESLDRFTAFETDLLAIPDDFVQISSIMPNKRNPVPLEHLRSLASLACGHCQTMVSALQNTPFGDINDAEENYHVYGYQALAISKRISCLFADLIDKIETKEEQQRLKEAENNLKNVVTEIIATDR